MSSVLKRSDAAAPMGPWLRRMSRWGRGRLGENAEHPVAIPAGGWLEIALRTARSAARHNLITTSAGVTFFAMLAFIPALSATASLYGLLANAETGLWQARALEGVAPADVLALINTELRRVVAAPRPQLLWTATAGLIAAIGSINAGVTAMLSGLNVAYEQEECRSFRRRALTAGLFTAGVVVLAPLTFGSLLVGRGLVGRFYLSREIVGACRFAFLAVVATASLALMYRYGPCRDLARWRWVTPGGILAAVAWMACSSAVSFYLAHVAHYQETYGVMGAMLAVMVWLWTASTVALLGAELNAQLEAQTDRDTRAQPGH